MIRNWFKLIILILATQLIGSLSGLLSGDIKHIYNTVLIKPPLSPPNWVFGIVWALLYLLMAIAVYFIYQSPKTAQRKSAIRLYWLQLIVNFIWSIVFFRFQQYWLAIAIIWLLVLLVALSFYYFYKINKAAGSLLFPYLIWIIFATYLAMGVAILN